jgi:predicted nucleic acid-binding protein
VGLTVLDAGVLIAVLDGGDAHHASARRVLSARLEDGDRFVVPASVYAEVLVGPFTAGDAAVSTVDDFLGRLGADIAPADAAIARRAAQLRSKHRRLRLPDALVIATAVHLGADRLLTTDAGWPPSRSLGVSFRIERIRQIESKPIPDLVQGKEPRSEHTPLPLVAELQRRTQVTT